MRDRVALRATCWRSRHIVAEVLATTDGYMVAYRVATRLGYGRSRFRVDEAETYPLDGPADDPEDWFTEAACGCGQTSELDSSRLRDAIARGDKVIVLPRALSSYGASRDE